MNWRLVLEKSAHYLLTLEICSTDLSGRRSLMLVWYVVNGDIAGDIVEQPSHEASGWHGSS